MSNNPNLPQNADEQIARLREALTQNAECGTTHYNLAVALLGKQEFAEAEKELHEAIDCSPTLAEAYVQLGGSVCNETIWKAATGLTSGPPRSGPALPKATPTWPLSCSSSLTGRMKKRTRRSWKRRLSF